MRYRRLQLLWMVALLFVGVLFGVTRADVLELKNGGRVQGDVDADAKDQPTDYVVTTGEGGRIAIPKTEVARVVSQSKTEREYDQKRQAVADTVGGHLQLAEWCRQQKLVDEYRQELVRVLELDPDHEQARLALGYQKKGGQWMSRDDIMAARGLVLHEGRFVTRQHVELLDRGKKAKLTDAEWKNQLERWRRWLTGRRRDKSDEALAAFRSLREPASAPALVDLLQREDDAAAKRLLIEVAAQLDHQAAVGALVQLSLADPDTEVRFQCLEHLTKSGRPGLAGFYIRALHEDDNVVVNRAAEALERVGDPEAIGPLVEVLVTKQKSVVRGGNPDQQSYMFTPSGGGGMTFGSPPAKVISRDMENADVLKALVKLSGGANFGYNQQQWRDWMAAQAKAHAVDLRRDL